MRRANEEKSPPGGGAEAGQPEHAGAAAAVGPPRKAPAEAAFESSAGAGATPATGADGAPPAKPPTHGSQPPRSPDEPSGPARLDGPVGLVGLLAAAAVTIALLLPIFWPVWRAGLSEAAPVATEMTAFKMGFAYRSDYRYTIWLASRNARALVTEPWALFDAPYCYPAKNSLAHGEAIVTHGAASIPFYWITGDPVLSFNLVYFGLYVLGAVAMFALVRSWTASFPAALSAALAFVLLNERLRDPPHGYIYDLTWLPIAMLFAQRLVAKGRLRDALGLAACVALQMGTTLYPLIAAAVVGLFFAAWLLARNGLGWARPLPLLALVGVIGAAGAFIYGPYLELISSGELPSRASPLYRSLVSLLPGGASFPGWATLVLALAAIGGPLYGKGRAWARARGNPGPVLLAGGVVCAWLALGLYLNWLGVPNLFAALAAWVPGFAAVRAPAKIDVGMHFALAALAGLGVAQLLLRVRGRAALAVACFCVLAVVAERRLPGFPGMPPPVVYEAEPVAPSPELFALHDALAEQDNDGPIFELPSIRGGKHYLRFTAVQQYQSEALMAAAYHRRPTSSCLSSNIPALRAAFDDVQTQIPSPEAFARLRAAGFTTLILHEPGHRPNLHARLEAACEGETPELARLYASERGAAYALLGPRAGG